MWPSWGFESDSLSSEGVTGTGSRGLSGRAGGSEKSVSLHAPIGRGLAAHSRTVSGIRSGHDTNNNPRKDNSNLKDAGRMFAVNT